MKNSFTILFSIILSLTAYGQKQANIWYFGNHAGLDFNNNPPTPLLNGQTDFPSPAIQWNEGCSSISDSSGFLLFYTNGMKIWNRMQQVMPNGNNLLGHSSSTQSSIIVPRPHNDENFYVFTTDSEENVYQNGLRFSIVDMCLDNGYGDIVSDAKNVLLMDSVTEKMICIRHTNESDYWIVTHKLNSNAYYSFKLTGSGITDTVVSYTTTPQFVGIGQMKASSDGLKIANATPNGYGLGGFHEGFTTILDFNPSTGVVSNEQTLPCSEAKTEYAVSFSPNGSKLYFSCLGHGEVYQYNMNAGSIDEIIASKTFIIPSGPDSWRQLQLGSDGKLYFSRTGKQYLSMIEFPDNLYPECNYIDSAIYLGGQHTSLGLPNFIVGFNYSNTTVQCSTNIQQLDNSEQVLNIYPNPFTSSFIIKTNDNEQSQLTLYDILSQKLLQQIFSSSITINAEQFSSGIYIYEVLSKDGRIYSGKLIKQ